MPQPLWGASALAKRYAPERGTETVDSLFESVPEARMVTTFLGYAETVSLLLRKRNRGEISVPTLRTALSSLQAETLNGPAFNSLPITEADIIQGVELMRRDNINASDAAILTAYLGYARLHSSPESPCVLIASDQRLLRAASLEGLATLDPEQVAPEAVPARLAAL